MVTICGIYKITSPSGKVYIGESIDINKRWKGYSYLKCEGQTRLINSFKKYGIYNHIFEIIEECTFENLYCRERYWQDFYDVTGKKGLNCRLTSHGELKGVMSKETIQKIIDNHADNSGENCYWFGKKLTKEHKDTISKTRIEKGLSKGENNPMYGIRLIGREVSEDTRKLLRRSALKNKSIPPTVKCLVLCTDIGIFCDSITEASKMLGIDRRLLNRHINNNTGKFPVIKV